MNFLRCTFLTMCIWLAFSPKTPAMLGYTVDENDKLYASTGSEPKYHFGGQKNVYIYRTDNMVITVVYRGGVSILESINYINPIEQAEAEKDMATLILPEDQKKPSFQSQMLFVNGEAIEYIYKKGIRTKILLDENGKATDIMSSMNSIKPVLPEEPTNETPDQ